MQTLLCTFNPVVGWRVHSASPFHGSEIMVVRILGKKYLQIPADGPTLQVRGRFCNPRKLALAYVRSLKTHPLAMLRLSKEEHLALTCSRYVRTGSRIYLGVKHNSHPRTRVWALQPHALL